MIQTKGTLEERMARVEQNLVDLRHYITNELKEDIEKLERRYDETITKIEKNCNYQFKWTISIVFSVFSLLSFLIFRLCVC